jgi:MerR family transcriptional regulator, redox-sensitive transcriptional activator SoxR
MNHMQKADELTIGEVGRQAGINTSTVRYYERIGLLPKSRRVNKHRRFEPDVLQKLELIHFAQESGFTLDEIKVLFQGFEPNTPPAERWQKLAQEKLPEVDALIARAQAMKRMLETGLNCRCLRLEDCAIEVDAGCSKD